MTLKKHKRYGRFLATLVGVMSLLGMTRSWSQPPSPPEITPEPQPTPAPESSTEPLSSPPPAETTARVVFAREGRLFVAAPDGSGERGISGDVESWSHNSPSWNPDRTRIAFMWWISGNREIAVMNADGSGVQRLTNHQSDDDDPAFSPDGRSIVWASSRFDTPSRGVNTEIYEMDADGSQQRNLTQREGEDTNPAWSPDGKKIAFCSNRAKDAHGDSGWDIYTMNRDGSDQKRITFNGRSYHPAWSPDGKTLAFDNIRYDGFPNGRMSICTIPAGGGKMRYLTAINGYNQNPCWSPDGKSLIFTSSAEDPHSDIYKFSVADGAAGNARLQRLTFTHKVVESAPDWK
ncbi:MAG TPA: hypothetical protein VF681_02950 [Abditibacteriaceae bacterium]|jgi:TolB protein